MLLQIEDLRLSLGGVTILQDVHLGLAEGEIYGLIGPNGAGKSTTIAAALGLLRPDAGRIRVLGEEMPAGTTAASARVGVLPERNGFYDWMTAEDYLGFFAALYRRPLRRPEITHRLEQVGLAPRPGQTIGTFSRGMRQRLGLARALVAEPALLILDEPTNGLDPRGRREFHDLLLALAAKGVGILLCTHLLDDVDRLCRRIGIIVAGRTVAEGAIAELIGAGKQLARFRLRLADAPPNRAEHAHVTVVAREGEWWIVDVAPGTEPPTAWRELLFCGWPVVEIRREAGGLEALYLTLTERSAG